MLPTHPVAQYLKQNLLAAFKKKFFPGVAKYFDPFNKPPGCKILIKYLFGWDKNISFLNFDTLESIINSWYSCFSIIKFTFSSKIYDTSGSIKILSDNIKQLLNSKSISYVWLVISGLLFTLLFSLK